MNGAFEIRTMFYMGFRRWRVKTCRKTVHGSISKLCSGELFVYEDRCDLLLNVCRNGGATSGGCLPHGK